MYFYYFITDFIWFNLKTLKSKLYYVFQFKNVFCWSAYTNQFSWRSKRIFQFSIVHCVRTFYNFHIFYPDTLIRKIRCTMHTQRDHFVPSSVIEQPVVGTRNTITASSFLFHISALSATCYQQRVIDTRMISNFRTDNVCT